MKHTDVCDVVTRCVDVVPAAVAAAVVPVDCVLLNSAVLSRVVSVLGANVLDVVFGSQIPVSVSSVAATENNCSPDVLLCTADILEAFPCYSMGMSPLPSGRVIPYDM